MILLVEEINIVKFLILNFVRMNDEIFFIFRLYFVIIID